MTQIVWLYLANILTIPTQIAMLQEQQETIQDIIDSLDKRQHAAEVQQIFILDDDQPAPSPLPSTHGKADDLEVHLTEAYPVKYWLIHLLETLEALEVQVTAWLHSPHPADSWPSIRLARSSTARAKATP